MISRIRIISFIIIAFTIVLLGKLYLVQIVHGDEFAERAERQYLRPNDPVFSRGSIFFENKDGTIVGAASLQSGFTVSINPKVLGNDEESYAKLSKIISLDRETFLEKAAKANDPYEEIAKHVDEISAKKIEDLKITGISIFKDRWRYYPGERLASHVIGLIGYKENILEGRYGLERYYEDVLSRRKDNLYRNFFAEIFSNVKDAVKSDSRFEGDIVTTIEPTVEAYLEKTLSGVEEKWHSKISGGIILNPMNGEIVALAVSPDFNPNSFQNEKSPRIFSNPTIENVYEMGSIIKPLTMAAGLDSKVVTAESTYRDDGFLNLSGYRISNFDGKGRGVVNMQEVLNQSLNTGAAYVAQKMGKENFSKYMLDFGIGEETGIDLPSEAHGLVDNLENPRDIELATAAYGQGIAMTPIAAARAMSTLGNGGFLPNPHIVKRIDYRLGFSKTVPSELGKRVISKETSEEITRMLVEVVDSALLGGTVKIKNYSVAAKTGTAQMARQDGKGYEEGKYLHSFFGYFPAYHPRFLVFLYTIEPQGVTYASHTLTNPFIDITKFLINYYEIPPDR